MKQAFFAFIMWTVITVAPASGQRTLEEIVARVNAEIILKSDYEAEQQAIREELQQAGLQGIQLDQAAQERSKNVLRDLIDNSLLMQQARDMGLSAELEVVKTQERMRQQHNRENPNNQIATIEDLERAISQQMSLDDFKQRIRTQYLRSQVLNREVYGRVIITTEDLRAYYEAHKKDFDKPEGIHIREITVNADTKVPAEVESQRKKIEEALAALKKGDDFGEVAQRFSESASAASGGDLGFFEKGQLSKELDDVISKLNKGQISDVLPTSFGFMILKVEDKHAGGVLPFESAQNEVYSMMFNERAVPKIREYLNRLRENGFVWVREGYVDTGAVSQ